MVDRCPPVESLPEIALLPLGGPSEDPRRRHLAACPRCQARLADYRDFMAGETPCPPRELGPAMAALDATLHAAIAGAPAPVRVTRPRVHPLFTHPLARIAYALAALFLLLVALDALPTGPARREIRLRGGEHEPGAVAFGLESPVPLAEGGLEFSWQALPGADEYRLRLLTPDLAFLAERPCGGATRLRLSAADLALLFPGAELIVWQVEARAGGDPLALSVPATYPLPQRP